MMTYTCPGCGKMYSPQLTDTWVLLCNDCGGVVLGDKNLPGKIPNDWSVIQIGSAGHWKGVPFKILGRVRLQLKDDFKNLWCAQYENKTLWIAQSLESVAFYPPPFAPFPDELNKPRSNHSIKFSSNTELKCEFIEQCTHLHFEGELSSFPFSKGGFAVIQASNLKGNSALIFQRQDTSAEFLWGEYMERLNFKFENIRHWNEWK
jgi:hypothetical protein